MSVATGAPTHADIEATLSTARLSTYVSAVGGSKKRAIALYSWNAHVSGALMFPLHIAEVAIRNAVSEAITASYSDPDWPWNNAFEISLPSSTAYYDPAGDLIRVRNAESSTGKVIPELAFAFWERMFTVRFQKRIWDPHLFQVFSNHPQGVFSHELREDIYDSLQAMRKLRNRVAHHEPIFNRNLSLDLSSIISLIELRSPQTAAWVRHQETVSGLLPLKP